MPYFATQRENNQPVNLYYELHGSGRPVLLVHTWPLNRDAWEKQTRALLQAGYRVIQYDRRGFGRSDRPSFGYDLQTLTSDLHHLIDFLDLQDAVLIGHSMGGAEVAHYLGQFGTARVRKAIYVACVNPYLCKAKENPLGIDRAIFDNIASNLLKDRPATLSAAISAMYNADTLATDRISKEKLAADVIVASQASPIAAHDCVSVFLSDLRADHETIDIPTLVIHGTADHGAPINSTGARTAQYPHSTLVAIKDAPHGLIWTHAEEVNQAILDFIR
jgi:non-heme chloroperoxidase